MGSGNSKAETKLLVLGLDNAGKSTVINSLKPDKIKANEILATPGFFVEKFKVGKILYSMIDMSGDSRYRELWQHYYGETRGIIFVIDASAHQRFDEASSELNSLLTHSEICSTYSSSSSTPLSLLIFANKQDVASALTSSQLADVLRLDQFQDKNTNRLLLNWHIQACSALHNEGIREGMDWLNRHI